MSAYVIAAITVSDPDQYEKYKPMASASVAKYGGRYLTRGGKFEVIEGDWAAPRTVVLEFESVEAARRWYYSPEYEAAKQTRAGAAQGNYIIIEGA